MVLESRTVQVISGKLLVKWRFVVYNLATEESMKTTVSKRKQTAVPAKLCERYGIKGGTILRWVDTGKGIKLIPLPNDPIASLRGSGKGESALESLLADRRRERERERSG